MNEIEQSINHWLRNGQIKFFGNFITKRKNGYFDEGQKVKVYEIRWNEYLTLDKWNNSYYFGAKELNSGKTFLTKEKWRNILLKKILD